MKSLGVVFIFLVLVVSIGFASAAGFGVTSEFSETRVLELEPGQTHETFFRVQNTVDNAQPMRVSAELVDGLEIASLNGDLERNFDVGDQEDFDVSVRIPSDAVIGDEYLVKVVFKQVESEGDGGTLQFGISIGGNFVVRVVDESPIVEDMSENESKGNIFVWILVIVVIVIIAWAVMKGTSGTGGGASASRLKKSSGKKNK